MRTTKNDPPNQRKEEWEELSSGYDKEEKHVKSYRVDIHCSKLISPSEGHFQLIENL